MKIEIPASSMEMLKQLLKELNLPDTIENREMIITVAINTGIAVNAMVAGAMIAIKEKTGIDPLECSPETEEPKSALVDGVCSHCNVRPMKLPDGRIVCNCREYKSNPV